MSNSGTEAPFWRTKQLEELDPVEWEALCDGCGRCCLLKIEDEESGDCFQTNLSCRLLDLDSCRCKDYANRHDVVADCIRIDPDAVRRLAWLPSSCAYRRVAEGRDLAWWHPLVSGNPDTVHEAGVSVRSIAIRETRVRARNLEKYITELDPAE